MISPEFPLPASTFNFRLTLRQWPDSPFFLESHPKFYKRKQQSIDLVVHPNNSGRIIINYPGLNEDHDGINLRYKTMAEEMQTTGLGAVIRTGNRRPDVFLPSTILKKIIDYSDWSSDLICDSVKPDILLMGFSAGANAVAATAGWSDRITRILLIAPSGDIPKKYVQASLERFVGEVYIIVGENDRVVGPKAGKIYYDLSSSASKRELFTVPGTSHFFWDKYGDMIFRQAPFYAFAKGEKPKLI